MAEATTDSTALKIPPEVAERFPEIIKLIKESRSMNDDERQYWIDALPVMSNDQLGSLRDILMNEKKQIEKAESAYQKNLKKKVEDSALDFNEAAYKEKKRLIYEAEKEHEEEEAKKEEAILKELENL